MSLATASLNSFFIRMARGGGEGGGGLIDSKILMGKCLLALPENHVRTSLPWLLHWARVHLLSSVTHGTQRESTQNITY